jgi:hypothetical protein
MRVKDQEAMTSVAGDSDDAKGVKGQLEDLQVATIYSLVENIQMNVGSASITVPTLYLTNNQANKFPFHDLSKVLQSLDISPEPKFVINLLDSRPFWPNLRDGHCDVSSARSTFGFEDPSASIYETNRDKYMSTITELSRFVHDKLLPLAIRTNALVVVGSTGSTVCALGNEFCRVVARQQQNASGKRLPFTVLCVTSSFHHTRRMDVPGTEVFAVKAQSRRWRADAANLRSVFVEKFGKFMNAINLYWSLTPLPFNDSFPVIRTLIICRYTSRELVRHRYS